MGPKAVAAILIFILLSVFSGSAAKAGGVSISPFFDRDLIAADAGYTFNGGRGSYFSQDITETKVDYIGWYAGQVVTSLYVDNSFFAPMTSDRGVDDISGRLMLGGAMFGMVYKNYRAGAVFLTGYQRKAELINNKRRVASAGFDGYGLYFEYNRMRINKDYPVRIPWLRVGYQVGVLAGMGDLHLTATGLDIGSSGKWSADESLYFVNPYAGVWISPFDWIWFQFDVGYAMSILDTENSAFEDDLGNKMVGGNLDGGLMFNFKMIMGGNPNI